MGEIWGAIGAVTALVAVGVAVAQLGGWRGLKRRALREDLELLKLLDDDGQAPARARLQARVSKKLEQYEPAVDVQARRRARWELAGAFIVLAGLAVVIVAFFDVTGFLPTLLVGGGLGIAGNVVLWMVNSRRDELEQDRAVAEMKLDAQRPHRQANFEAHTDPEQADQAETATSRTRTSARRPEWLPWLAVAIPAVISVAVASNFVPAWAAGGVGAAVGLAAAFLLQKWDERDDPKMVKGYTRSKQ